MHLPLFCIQQLLLLFFECILDCSSFAQAQPNNILIILIVVYRIMSRILTVGICHAIAGSQSVTQILIGLCGRDLFLSQNKKFVSVHLYINIFSLLSNRYQKHAHIYILPKRWLLFIYSSVLFKLNKLIEKQRFFPVFRSFGNVQMTYIYRFVVNRCWKYSCQNIFEQICCSVNRPPLNISSIDLWNTIERENHLVPNSLWTKFRTYSHTVSINNLSFVWVCLELFSFHCNIKNIWVFTLFS